MDLSLTAEEDSFRLEVRDFLRANLPAEIRERVRLGLPVGRADLNRWQQILASRGWLAPNWPAEYGGTGWNLTRRHIFDMECRLAHCPPVMAFNFNMLGPALIAFGTAEQKAYYLPRILDGTDWWCQGYSEPEAGSDLASLRTRADSDGDDYVVNGAKIWTSAAEEATHIFALVRTDPEAKPQTGISFLLIEMTSPGIRVEPLIALNGRRLWNQVFFDDVRVPKANRLGAENEGWRVAKKLLGDERFFVSRVSENRRMLSVVKAVAAEAPATGGRLIDDADFALQLADLERRLDALEVLCLRLLSAADAGRPVGAEPSMAKLLGSHLVQDMDEALLACVASYALPEHAEFLFRGGNQLPVGPDYATAAAANYFHHRGFTIAGGTSEVQRNILAKQTLGL